MNFFVPPIPWWVIHHSLPCNKRCRVGWKEKRGSPTMVVREFRAPISHNVTSFWYNVACASSNTSLLNVLLRWEVLKSYFASPRLPRLPEILDWLCFFFRQFGLMLVVGPALMLCFRCVQTRYDPTWPNGSIRPIRARQPHWWTILDRNMMT
jgi:hypothetical protein